MLPCRSSLDWLFQGYRLSHQDDLVIACMCHGRGFERRLGFTCRKQQRRSYPTTESFEGLRHRATSLYQPALDHKTKACPDLEAARAEAAYSLAYIRGR